MTYKGRCTECGKIDNECKAGYCAACRAAWWQEQLDLAISNQLRDEFELALAREDWRQPLTLGHKCL